MKTDSVILNCCCRLIIDYRYCIAGCLLPANFLIPPGILDPAEDVYRPGESITFSCSSEYNFFGIPQSFCSEADGFIFPGTEDNICLQGETFFFLVLHTTKTRYQKSMFVSLFSRYLVLVS